MKKLEYRHQIDKIWTSIVSYPSIRIPDIDYWLDVGMVFVEDVPRSGLIYWRKR